MNVAELLGRDLAAARRAGLAFEDAWPEAVKRAVAVERRDERTVWRSALADTRPTWESAWHREMATRAQVAVLAVAPEREPLAA